MPRVFFVKDGSGDEHTSQAYTAKLADVVNLIKGFELRFFENGPFINSQTNASPFALYRYVVVEVGEGELTEQFTRVGFYLVVGLDVKQTQASLGISNLQ